MKPLMVPEYDTTPIPLDLTGGVMHGMIEIEFMLLCGGTELLQREEELVLARMGPPRTGLRLQSLMAENMRSHGS